MVHPFQRIAAKLRAAGKLASKKEIAATRRFYELDDFGDALEDEVIIKENRERVRQIFFHPSGACKNHQKFSCKECLDMLNG